MPTTLAAYMSNVATQSCECEPAPVTAASSASSDSGSVAAPVCTCTCSAGVLCNLFAGPGWAGNGRRLPSRLDQGRIAGGGLVIGGAVLTQTRRFHAARCDPIVRALTAAAEPLNTTSLLYTSSRYCTESAALAPFGFGLPNTTAAPGISRSFSPSVPPGGPADATAAANFRAYFSAFDDVGAATAAGPSELYTAGWLDDDTATVQLSFAVVHPNLRRITTAKFIVYSPEGGHALYDTSATTFLIDPYAIPSTIVLDVFM